MVLKWFVVFSLKKMVLLVVQGLKNCHFTINTADAQILVSAYINTGGYNQSKEDEHDHKEENDQGCVSHKIGMNQ